MWPPSNLSTSLYYRRTRILNAIQYPRHGSDQQEISTGKPLTSCKFIYLCLIGRDHVGSPCTRANRRWYPPDIPVTHAGYTSVEIALLESETTFQENVSEVAPWENILHGNVPSESALEAFPPESLLHGQKGARSQWKPVATDLPNLVLHDPNAKTTLHSHTEETPDYDEKGYQKRSRRASWSERLPGSSWNHESLSTMMHQVTKSLLSPIWKPACACLNSRNQRPRRPKRRRYRLWR
jgi:hypothetical protein